jgi:hypothetical protein
MTAASQLRSWFPALLTAAFCVLAAGCGTKGPTLYPVTGKVTGADGKPVENASVVFHPVVEPTDPNYVRPQGRTGPDGTFRLTTYAAGDGAQSGEYRVTVELWLVGRPDEPPINRLPAKYGKPETTSFKATVNPAPTELTPFAIQK